MVMNTGNNPTDISFQIFVWKNQSFRRSVYEKAYTSAVINDETNECIPKTQCFKLVVYYSEEDRLKGQGSYQAYWDGK